MAAYDRRGGGGCWAEVLRDTVSMKGRRQRGAAAQLKRKPFLEYPRLDRIASHLRLVERCHFEYWSSSALSDDRAPRRPLRQPDRDFGLPDRADVQVKSVECRIGVNRLAET
jgi:hypothetical protein